MDPSKLSKPQTQKETASCDESQDFISNLPEEIKGKILSYLSSRDAVQTCILSSMWRYTWALITKISIREAEFVFPNASVRINRSRFVKFVDALLYHHTGSIFKFKLDARYHYGDNNFPDAFDCWILHLSRRNAFSEFSFNLRSMILYDLPTSLFSCRGLSILKLHDCRINLPRGFQGFKLMRRLELHGCSITGDDPENFVSGCPILDELVMKTETCWVFNPKICATKLKKLIIHGGFYSLVLNTPCLVNACFNLEDVPTWMDGRANLIDALGALPEVEVLCLHQQFLAYLAAGSLPDDLPITLDKLRMLTLNVNLASHEEASVARLLLQNAPNLQELNLTNSYRDTTPTCAGLWQICSSRSFMSLRVVEIYEFFISAPEIAFLQYILGSAPFLEQLTVVSEKDTYADEIEAAVEILEKIPKASINLQISFQ